MSPHFDQSAHSDHLPPSSIIVAPSACIEEPPNPSQNYNGEDTPLLIGKAVEPKVLFKNLTVQDSVLNSSPPKDIDLEVLLVNSCKINAIKVQTIVNNFIEGKDHTVIFCMTETKVDSHDFQPQGITIFSAHRTQKELKKKKGGGLAIGFATKADISLKNIATKSNDILALEGTVLKSKFRIILCYFDSTKSLSDQFYNNNRKMQAEVEALMEVDPETNLICLGDMNGRLSKLEPLIKTDANGRMVEKWSYALGMHHLNCSEQCTGLYTFDSLNGRSAIDHVLVNSTLHTKYIGMFINETRDLLNISDHNLIRTWFKLNPGFNKPKWKNVTKKTISWISRDSDRLEGCALSFKERIGKKKSFNKCMNKLKSCVNIHLRRRKVIKLAGKGQVKMISAPWVDSELNDHIKHRSFLNKEWRRARKRGEPDHILKIYKDRYLEQKSITALMTGDKKSHWEKNKIQ